ncbi:hypothetical protein [Streptomyces sp. NBC_01465]|uniref:hypothetical protein n=1 Tax=Streptomyces sp. NBC_01465 TaxID=2903878 RepID=UPI002E2FF6D4|nr:hypothetical protein [Streptomyces sp. NBC_01465]
MASWRTSRANALLTAGLALTAVTAVATPATANAPVGADDWGTVVDTTDCLQADAWVARVKGLGSILDTALFESHYPSTPKAPTQQAGGNKLVDLAPGGIGIGKVSALYSRAMGHSHPNTVSGGTAIPARGEAYADAGGAAVDVGVPYVQNPLGGTQLSPLGVHVEGITVSAYSKPGKAVAFTGGAARGYISVAGARIIEIPPIWATNLGVRIPEDYSKPPLATATTNEQVTTDSKGMPTLGPDGHYKFDPKATSGYVTGIHASVLGTEVADVTVAHAAVIRDAARTDKFALTTKASAVRSGAPAKSVNCTPFAPPAQVVGAFRNAGRTACW